MKYFCCFLVLIIAISLSCSSDQNTSSETGFIKLNLPESGEDTLKVSYFADSVIYIPLETKKESFIQHIKQLWMNDSVMLLNDFGGGLLMFSQNGKFIMQIGQNGRGPGEYLSILHFDVIDDTIYISSTGRRSLLRYTFEGTFCDEIMFNYQPAYFSSTADQKLACYIHGDGKIFVYNKNFRSPPDTITVEYGVTDGRYRWIHMLNSGYNYLQKTQSGLLFNSFMSDTIWNIKANIKEPAFILNMKNKLLPYDKQIEFSNGDFESYHKMASPYSFVHLIPYPSLMFAFQLHYTIYDDCRYEAIYFRDANTGQVRKFNTHYIFDDLISNQMLPNERLTFFYPMYPKDYLVTSKKPLDLLKYLNKTNNKDPSPLWRDQMKNIKEDDNPILIKIKIKKTMQ